MMANEAEFLDAIKRGDAQSVADLLRAQPELTRLADEYAKTGLHWAAETDQLETFNTRRFHTRSCRAP